MDSKDPDDTVGPQGKLIPYIARMLKDSFSSTAHFGRIFHALVQS